ncbi:MAG TPA: LamG domain-containing protein, partial [Planctomycetaceae bacterium]|nr:LamG domain-containing protein [Planctomycetaceae bacterium]
MRRSERWPLCKTSLVTLTVISTLAAAPPWQQPYSGKEATGEQVIAAWHFDADAPARDASGHGHDLTLRGQAQFVEDGRFGGCLESFPAGKDNDHPQGALVKNAPRLTPRGAFTIELWMQAKPELSQSPTAFLLDKKYYHYAKDLPQANRDYCLYLRRAGQNTWRIVAFLGFGEDSAEFASEVVQIVPGRWYHVAFVYDGRGTGRLFLDGRRVGRIVHEGRGAVVPGPYDLVIGDRYG